jgi:lysozyme
VNELGFDLSDGDGAVDFTLAAQHQITFATIRATWSTSGIDPRYVSNNAGALTVGMRRAAYHWYTPNKTNPLANAHQQAAHFLAHAVTDLPAMLDLEDTTAVKGYRGVHAEILTWLADIEAATGLRPWVYTNKDYATRYFHDYLGRFNEACRPLCAYPLVVASWNQTQPSIPLPWHPGRWAAWQFYSGAGGNYYGLAAQGVSLYVSNGGA